MPSPFPGMNPYLEQDDAWHDFHKRFIPAAATLLASLVRANYIVKIAERAQPKQRSGENRFRGCPAVAIEEVHESCVEIRDREDRKLVCIIELLSPSNKKRGEDPEQYLTKRRQLIASGVHLVELDLLRGGPRMPLEEAPQSDYLVMVSRAEERPRVGIWPVQLRETLPRVPVPLRSPHPDAWLDLQGLIHRIHDEAGYGDYIYGGEPRPPLSVDDAAWAQALLSNLTGDPK